MRPLLVGKKRQNSYKILPEPQRKVVVLPNNWTGKDLKEYLENQVRIKENEKLIERQLKIEKLKKRIYENTKLP